MTDLLPPSVFTTALQSQGFPLAAESRRASTTGQGAHVEGRPPGTAASLQSEFCARAWSPLAITVLPRKPVGLGTSRGSSPTIICL